MDPEYQKYLNDLESHPLNEYSEIIDGYEIKISRNIELGHWCGYLKINALNDEKRKIVFNNFHHGITYDDDDDWYGFDCAHGGDYVPCNNSLFIKSKYLVAGNDDNNQIVNNYANVLSSMKAPGTFKTFDYVRAILLQTIKSIK